MSSVEEREAFRQRLRASLDRAGWRAIGATTFAREFNRRSASPPVTPHATRKWLHGEAIPAQNNLRELAEWLGVPAQWLRFGEEPVLAAPLGVSEAGPAPYGSDRLARLASAFKRLNADQQDVVEALVGVLLRRRGKPAPTPEAPASTSPGSH